MVLWFVLLALAGAWNMMAHPGVPAALDPRYAIGFLAHANWLDRFHGPRSVFLALTGGEALYADMGHFGRGAIRVVHSRPE